MLDRDGFKRKTEMHCFNPGPLYSHPLDVTKGKEELPFFFSTNTSSF
jgi:hypothetical protein